MGRDRLFDWDQIATMAESGMTCRTIADELGCGESTVHNALREMGVAPAKAEPVSKMDVPLLFRLWAEGVAPEEIALQLGVSTGTVSNLKRRYKLPTRPPIPRPEVPAPTPEDDEASGESLRFSPWVQRRIDELRLGLHGGAA